MTPEVLEKQIEELNIRIIALEEQITAYKALRNSLENLLEQTIKLTKKNN